MTDSSQNNNPLLDKKLINAFIDGIVKTLSTMAMTEVKVHTPNVEKKLAPRGDVAGLIGMVAGGTKGNLTLSFEANAVFKILYNMLGESYSEINEDVTDAVGELTNMIYGCAKTKLNECGYGFEMAIPTVVSGNFTIAQHHNGATLVIPFSIDEDKFYCQISVQ